MAFPPAHLLVGFGAAELTRAAYPLPRWRAWAVAGVLAVLPDVDIVLGRALEVGFEYHGTFTHSVTTTLIVALVARLLAGPGWALLAASSYGSHLLVDLLDDRGQTNVMLGWPFSGEYAQAFARVFPPVPFEKGGGVVHAALSLLQPHIFQRLLLQTAVGAFFFFALVGIAWTLREARGWWEERDRREGGAAASK
ncbi:MAG: metal-dependent hydrolase [Gemmatimonadota bacterium]|nr:metal-dependent hydrolase [Gemmatimonadota bacterium]